MPYDMFLGFDSSDPADKEQFDQIVAERRARLAGGVSNDFIRHIKLTKTGRDFLIPLAGVIVPNQAYTRAQLQQLVPALTEEQVFARIRVLGRPEKVYRARVFERPADGQYVMTTRVRDALLAA